MKLISCAMFFGLLNLILPALAWAQAQDALPNIALSIGGSNLTADGTISATLKITLLLTILSFAPALVLTMTSFTRIVIVLGMTRTALGTTSAPPNSVITGLALFLTFAIMGPVFNRSYNDGVKPFLEGSMDQRQALEKSLKPFQEFLVVNAREKDLQLFLNITKSETPKETKDIPLPKIINKTLSF